MKKEIITKNLRITLNSTKGITFIKINYTPETSAGKFPDINRYEDYCIINQICPFERLEVKDSYSDNELIMITEFLAYVKATEDLSSNNIATNDMCSFIKESDLSFTYTLYMATADNETARNLIEYSKKEQKRKHSERTKKGIQHHKKLREQS